MRRSVAVIGGGISGLAAAHRLIELDPSVEVMLLESGQRVGGVLQTAHIDGFLFEGAADSLLATPPIAVDLCCRLGLEDELIGTEETCRQALVLRQGRLLPVPIGFHLMAPSRLWPLLSSPILSWRGKMRAGLECLIPSRASDEDESVHSFVCRRFGHEMFERMVQPLVGGIYTGDPQQLSIEATFPRFRQMERQHGSLLRAMWCQTKNQPAASGARYGQFATLRGGMAALVKALADRLPNDSIRLDSAVTGVFPTELGRWLLTLAGRRPTTTQVDGVIFAAPTYQTAQMLQAIDTELSKELGSIPYASCAVVGLGYRRDQIVRPLNGFGFVVPLMEQRMILSCSFSSVKYAGRAPEGSVLLRVFIGGASQGGLLQLSRAELMELAEREVAELLQIRGEPAMRQIVRHSRAMPQYHVGHPARVARIDRGMKRFPSLALAGSSLYGVGVPSCIQSGEAAAARIMQSLRSTRSTELTSRQIAYT